MISEPDKQDENDEADEVPNYQEQLLARIRQMKADGAVFISGSDVPDSGDTLPRGFTLFPSRSSFGR